MTGHHPLAAVALCTLSACGAPEGDDTAAPAVAPCDTCLLTDDLNYDYAPDLTAPSWQVAPGVDLRVSWADLTTDLLGHALDPASLDRALLLVFPELTPDEILDGLAHDTIDQPDVTLAMTCTPQESRCALSDFHLAGNHLDVHQYLLEGSGTWLVAPGREGEAGIATLALFAAQEGAEPVEERSIAQGEAALQVEVDLAPRGAIAVQEGAFPVLDWSGLTVDALGNPISLSRTDRLRVGRYDLDEQELEERFLDIELLAVETWEVDTTGQTSWDTARISGFPGFTAGDTWLVVLECSTCMNPAPRFLGRVDVIGS